MPPGEYPSTSQNRVGTVTGPMNGCYVPSTAASGAPDSTDPRRGTGLDLVFPTKFDPPNTWMSPLDLFSAGKKDMGVMRNTLPYDRSRLLIHTDGACHDNGRPNPRAGWAFWYGHNPDTGMPLLVSGRLEQEGPFRDPGLQTNNRAELRAVVAALRFFPTPPEGFRTFVIATDSKHVVEGATTWARTWTRNGWRTNKDTPVVNRDLWEALLDEVKRHWINGMYIEFWWIRREWNRVADAAANAAARLPDQVEWKDLYPSIS